MAQNIALLFEQGKISLDQWQESDPAGLAAYLAVSAIEASGREAQLMVIGSLASPEEFGKAMADRGIPWNSPMQIVELQDHRRTFQAVAAEGMVPNGDPRINPYDTPDGPRLFRKDWASLTTMPIRGQQVIGMLVRIRPHEAAALGPRERDGLLKVLRNENLRNGSGEAVFDPDAPKAPVVLTFVSQPQTLVKFGRNARVEKKRALGEPRDMALRIGYLTNSIKGLEGLPNLGTRAVRDVTSAAAQLLRDCTADESVLVRLAEVETRLNVNRESPELVGAYKQDVIDLLKESGVGLDADLLKRTPGSPAAVAKYDAVVDQLVDRDHADDKTYATRLSIDPEFLDAAAVRAPFHEYAHFTAPQLVRALGPESGVSAEPGELNGPLIALKGLAMQSREAAKDTALASIA